MIVLDNGLILLTGLNMCVQRRNARKNHGISRRQSVETLFDKSGIDGCHTTEDRSLPRLGNALGDHGQDGEPETEGHVRGSAIVKILLETFGRVAPVTVMGAGRTKRRPLDLTGVRTQADGPDGRKVSLGGVGKVGLDAEARGAL